MENALITITLRFCQKEKEQALYGLESVVSVKQNLVHLDSNMQQQNGWHKLTICLHHGPCKGRGGYLQNSFVGMCGPLLPETLWLYKAKAWDFSYAIYDLAKTTIPYVRPKMAKIYILYLKRVKTILESYPSFAATHTFC